MITTDIEKQNNDPKAPQLEDDSNWFEKHVEQFGTEPNLFDGA